LRKPRLAVLAGVVAVAAVATLSGCGTSSQPDPNKVVLYYEAGPTQATKFVECQYPGTKHVDGVNDLHYGYPSDQRFLDATPDSPDGVKPFTTVSKDNAQMVQPVKITFTLNTDCTILRLFHERFGLRTWTPNGDHAYTLNDGDEPGPGWLGFVKFALSAPADTTLDRIEQGFNWKELWNDPATKAKVETEFETKLPDLVWQQLGSLRIKDGKLTTDTSAPKVQFLQNFNITVLKPDCVDTELCASVSNGQKAESKATADVAAAKAREAAANAEAAVARAEAAKSRAEVDAYGKDLWLDKYRVDKENETKQKAIAAGINPYPSPILPPTGVASR
jgi:hypothetical protein